MAAYLSPLGGAGWQFFTATGAVLNGGKITTYLAGSTTLQSTWTDSTQATLNANPIILNSDGRPPNEIWLASGSNNYKFVVTASDGSGSKSYDNITGIAASNSVQSEWVTSGFVVTYISPTSFSVPGNQTAVLNVNRRLQYIVTGGTFYGTVLTSAYTTLTTVTVTPDSTNLDNTLSAVNYGFMSATNNSVPVVFIPSLNPIMTGIVNMAGATTVTAPTPAVGDNSTKVATTAFATQLSFAAALPAQPGGAITYKLTTKSSVVSWAADTSFFAYYTAGGF